MKTARALRITADPRSVSMAAAIRAAAQAAPLLALTARALGDLAAELGSMDAPLRHLLGVAENLDKPIGIDLPTGPDRSSTAFIAPRGWTEERLSGWVGGHHRELEDAFGEVARVGAELVGRGV